jgi:hypothetical protein
MYLKIIKTYDIQIIFIYDMGVTRFCSFKYGHIFNV